MNLNLDPDKDKLKPEELDIDRALRPKRFKDFEGQEKIMDNLEVFVQAAILREEALDHVLLHESPHV